MPALQFQDLPAAETQKIRDTLHTQWQIEARALNVKPFKSQQQANAESAKLDAKYQQMELKALTQLQQQQQEDQRVQELVKQPKKRTRAEEAQLRMELGPEAERLVFPGAPKRLSVQQVTSPALQENIRAYADASPTEHEFFTRRGKEPKTKQGIINQYLRWRESIAYDAIKSPLVRRQLDIQWDEAMAEDPRYNKWWLNREKRQPIVEIRALRTPGDIGKVMRGRIVGATPLGTAVTKAKPGVREAIGSAIALQYPLAGRAMEAMRPEAKRLAAQPKPIRQRSRSTGQERISYDGGRTWEILNAR